MKIWGQAMKTPSALRMMFGLLALLPLLTACDRDPPPQALEQTLLRDAAPHERFEGSLNGQPVLLVVSDCKVYLREPATDGASAARWVKVLEPEFYPSFTTCVRQSLSADRAGKGVRAFLGEQAFGGGGCCATGGEYRSTDGRTWTQQ